MGLSQRQPVRRTDYRPPAFTIERVDLHFELGEAVTVRASLHVRRQSADANAALELDGEELDLRAVSIDGQPLPPQAYRKEATGLTVFGVPDSFTLQTEVVLHPDRNTALEGLYRSGPVLCTQCEAQGFRRITYFIDRPDVLARYTTTIVGDRTSFPVMLANGNRVEEGSLEDGRQFVRWEDPFPKPSYLFALVAGELQCRRGSFTTMSGRDVALEIWTPPRNLPSTAFALEALQAAMRWDEEVYGREYDLDVYMIVAVDDFNMGAMENKGLNVFNSQYVLAQPTTATDDDYENIEAVIAHEYFHNWTGNRVTCRDWFQLTLKEGLTVFRDAQFTADQTSAAVKRINDAVAMRTAQFAEDQSPTAHPIRPEAYLEMNNFYTITVYHKGCEVVRMLHTLLRPEGFRRGLDLYFERHDGQAVTCEDFVAALADANEADLEQFFRWYGQAGTPIVEVTRTYDAATKRLRVVLRQHAPVNVAPEDYQLLHIPFALAMLAPDGGNVPPQTSDPAVEVRDGTALVNLREAEHVITFENVDAPPVLSLLRDFSAPVKLRHERTTDELLFLMQHDDDGFSRWDAANSLASSMLFDLARTRADERRLDPRFSQAVGHILGDTTLDGSFKALLLRLPEERMLAQQQECVDVDGLHDAYWFAMAALGRTHEQTLLDIVDRCSDAAVGRDRASIDARRLKNAALAYLVAGQSAKGIDRARTQLERFENMTDVDAALVQLVHLEEPWVDECLQRFYDHYESQPLVIDKWFRAVAQSRRTDALDRVEALSRRSDFVWTNPNRVRALLGTFSLRNPVRFHDRSGRGYRFLADAVLRLDAINPQVAARVVGGFVSWRRYDEARQALMRGELQRIAAQKRLSNDVYELVTKALGDDTPASARATAPAS